MKLSGTTASPGIVHGLAVVYEKPDLTIGEREPDSVDAEASRLRAAATTAVQELKELQDAVRGRLGDEFAHIFRSQQTIAEDDAILGEVVEALQAQPIPAEKALTHVFQTYTAMFDELSDDDYNKSRGADIHDVYQRILRILLGVPEVTLARVQPGSIIVAKDLLPSDTATMDVTNVKGIVTAQGGPTSHVAILARNLGIPAAVAVPQVCEQVEDGMEIGLDATDPLHADVYIGPTADETRRLDERDELYRIRTERSATYAGRKPLTRDGHEVEFSVNVGATEELAAAVATGVQSIGLYRSEFLFLNSARLPDEERQFNAYRAAAEQFSGGYVVIRTLDIGGDKQIPGMALPAEENPFLGNRGIRLCLSQPELFRVQLRAILRASAFGEIRIMFPMVSGLPEVEEALELLSQEREKLREQGIPYDDRMQTGVMIEVPSAVFLSDELAQRVDFFSIGTNDLTQYILASDRLNHTVARYYRQYDPSVFRAIRQVVESAHRYGRWVGVCGELGGDPRAVPALLGLGVDELSMSASSVAEATFSVCTDSYEGMKHIAGLVTGASTDTEVASILAEHYTQKEQNA